MVAAEDEPLLIQRARGGSAEAYCELVRLHQAAVRGYVARYLRGRDVVDDVAQEVLLAGYRSLQGFDGSSLRFWLLGIARHRVALFLREELRRRAHELGALETAFLARQAELVEQEEPGLPYQERELAALHECLKRLPPAESDMVKGYYFRAETSVEMAKRLGKSDAAVRMALMRLRQALRACVEKRLALAGPQGSS